MTSPAFQPQTADEKDIRALYEGMLTAWNNRDGDAFAAPFAEDGITIGFDGSEHAGRAQIASEIGRIFADHATGRYIWKVRSVRLLGSDVGILRAISGLVSTGQTDLNPQVNALQTLVAARLDGQWRTILFQNTPAQYHGRPELLEEMTAELRALL
jgi:uncharacterized protein (TIGR02246 family)